MPPRSIGARDARATLDGDPDAAAAVVACPPHPQQGGRRTDARLRAVSEALGERDVACLRFDYGPWDGGRGERRDAAAALAWARERFARVGLFGYSFGACVALAVAAGDRPDSAAPHAESASHPDSAAPHAASTAPSPDAVSALAPTARIAELDALGAVDAVDAPLQVLCGQRDEVADCATVAARARERGAAVETLPADHHFVGQTDAVADRVVPFLADRLRPER